MAKRPLLVVDPRRREFGFPRTVCACAACVLNCRHLPGYLIPADLERIRLQMAANEDLMHWARKHLLASPEPRSPKVGKSIVSPRWCRGGAPTEPAPT